jgi:hypothetical protein
MALSAQHGLPADGGASLLSRVTGPLRSADLTLGNLEGTLGSGGSAKCPPRTENCFSFQAPPSYARHYARGGFDLLNLANNHAFDYGADGQAQTIAALNGAGLRHAGRPGQVTVVRSHGVRVAVVGFAPYPWASRITDIPGAQALVRAARRRGDVVVVLMHAGGEGTDQAHTPAGREYAYGEDRGDTRGFAHGVVDAGADLVLGSGPHVIRGMERYRGRLIAYSLGDFLGHHTFGLGGALSLSGILRVTVDAGGRFRGGRWTAVRLESPGVPVPDESKASTRLVANLSEQDFGANAVSVDEAGRLR